MAYKQVRTIPCIAGRYPGPLKSTSDEDAELQKTVLTASETKVFLKPITKGLEDQFGQKQRVRSLDGVRETVKDQLQHSWREVHIFAKNGQTGQRHSFFQLPRLAS